MNDRRLEKVLQALSGRERALLFLREFLVTAMRSSFELRQMSLKSTYLAKVKTWTQMQGIGVILLFPMLGNDRLMPDRDQAGSVGSLEGELYGPRVNR